MAEDVPAKEEGTRPTAGRLAQALKRVETSGWKENRQETQAPRPSKVEPLSRETLVKGIAKLEGTTPQKVEEKVIDRRREKDIERFKDIMATTKTMEEEKRKWEEGSYERFLKRRAKVSEEARGGAARLKQILKAQGEVEPDHIPNAALFEKKPPAEQKKS